MASCFYKKTAVLLVIVLVLISISSPYASNRLWPSAMNLYNDTISLDNLVPKDATTSNSKKGVLFTGDPKEIFDLGCGQIAINITLSGKGHTYVQYLEGFKKRGIKTTLILVNDKATVNLAPRNDTPEEFKNPYFYMIDFNSSNGEWQRLNFERILKDYGECIDNWIIGNEINSQIYNYYGPSNIRDYTKVYCDTFKIIHDKIKAVNEDANLFISFDQCWDAPQFNEKHKKYDKINGMYRYNTKEQLALINEYLGEDIDWGVALHPYPAPVDDAKFWDDEYSGFDPYDKIEKERPYLLTAKNFELAIAYLNDKKFLTKDGNQRKILLSELAFTAHNGEEIQAAGIYYIWEKIMKFDKSIDGLLYNAQTDLPDGFNFGLSTEKGKKRLAWAVYKDMDRENENGWCKDLLDRVLAKYGYMDVDNVIMKIPKEVKETKKATSAVIMPKPKP